jgi:hypothetical protein
MRFEIDKSLMHQNKAVNGISYQKEAKLLPHDLYKLMINKLIIYGIAYAVFIL